MHLASQKYTVFDVFLILRELYMIVYIILCGLVISQLINRRFDFLSIGAVSYIFYTSSCFVANVKIPGGTDYLYNTAINFKTYIIIYCQLFIMFIVLFASNHNLGKRRHLKNQNDYHKNKKTIRFWDFMLIISAFIFLYNIFIRIGLLSFFSYASKAELSGRTGVLYQIAIWAVLGCFVNGVLTKSRIRIIVSLFLILITFIIGSRAYLATAMASVLVMYAAKIKNILKSNLKVLFLGLLMILILMLYKNVYSELRALDLEGAIYKLRNMTSIIDVWEFRIICAVYNFVVENGICISVKDSFARVVSIVPFLNDYIHMDSPIRFSDSIQHEFFHASYGLGGNFWAETYAMGGVVFLCLMTFVWLIYLDNMKNKTMDYSSVFNIIVASYLSFYIHRLDWIQVLGCIKSVFCIYILYFLWNIFDTKSIFPVVRLKKRYTLSKA